MDYYITEFDLVKHKYSMEVLKANLDHLSGRTIVCTQDISLEFYLEYIYVPSENDDMDEELHDIYWFMQHQPKLDGKECLDKFIKYINELKG